MFLKRLTDGTVVAELANEAVPQSVLHDIWNWREQGISKEDILHRLRTRTVPPGYTFHTWKSGTYMLRLALMKLC